MPALGSDLLVEDVLGIIGAIGVVLQINLTKDV